MRRRALRRAWRIGVVLIVVGNVGGCAWVSSWFARRPAAAPTAAATVAIDPEADDRDVQPASAAEAACANYAQTVRVVPFPREAIIRGLDAGSASVRFAVDDTTVTILSVRSSDPAFGNVATDAVKSLACRVDRPTRFDVPFSWRTTR